MYSCYYKMMQDTNDNRIAHLKMIEEVIKRMASNSFLVKGWSITLVSALVALSITNKRIEIAYLAIVPAFIFWGLDAYWLRQERLFRALYNLVRSAPQGSLKEDMFSMATKSFSGGVPRLFPNSLFNHGIWILHGVIVAAAVIVAVIVINGNGTGK